MKSLIVLTVGLAGLAAPTTKAVSQEAVEAVAIDETGGKIMGKFVWEGDKPEPKPDIVYTEKESQGCKHGESALDKKDRSLLIHEKGGVADIVVTLEVEGFERELPKDPVVLDQEGCRFEPHVLIVPSGAKLRFDNSDETNHNVHSYSKKNQAVNNNVASGSNFEQVLDKTETFEVKCDIHPWMKAYVVVTDATHFAKTGADGSFTIENVPAGKYKLNYWHGELGKGKTEEFTVTAGEVAQVDQKVSAKAKAGKAKRRRR